MLLYIYLAFFVFWFVCTVLWQIEYCRENFKVLRIFNFFNILPVWTFFAPKPGVNDIRLLFRDKDTQGNLSEWQEVLVFENRKWYHFLWNPKKRYNKLVLDSVAQLKGIMRAYGKQKIEDDYFEGTLMLSQGYIVLLAIVSDLPYTFKNTYSRQFLVVETNYMNVERDNKPLMISSFHDI